MDQILVRVCCHPQSEHTHQKVVNSHVGVILKRRQKCPKIHVFLLRHIFFWPGSISGTTTDTTTSIINTLLEPLLPVCLTFGRLVDTVSHLGG